MYVSTYVDNQYDISPNNKISDRNIKHHKQFIMFRMLTNLKGRHHSPAVACWASDHWVASSNPLRGKFRH